MRLKKQQKSGRCDAHQCRKAAIQTHTLPDGSSLEFCEIHSVEAQKEYATEGGEEVKIAPLTEETEAITTPPTPDERQKKQLAQERKDLEEGLEMVKAFEISGDQDVTFAEDELVLVKRQWEEYEEKRTSVTKPLNQALKEFNSWFRPVQNALKAIEVEWKRKLSQHLMTKKAEQEALVAQAREAEAPGEIREALVQASEAVVKVEKVQFRERWSFEIVDPDLIPREFMIPDERKIGQIVAALKDKTTIPGVRVWLDPIVASRG